MNFEELNNIVSQGESDAVEFKKSTGQLRRAGETLCGMLNGSGGIVLIGVTPEGRIVPGLFEREDEPLFPLEALREALVNAFCHRDYTIIGGSVSLAIYDDRLEIWSDGALPFGLKPARTFIPASKPADRQCILSARHYRTMGPGHTENRGTMRQGRSSRARIRRAGRQCLGALSPQRLYRASSGGT